MTNPARDAALVRLRALLEQARRERRTITYLQAADAVGVEPPQRIHKLARLVEILLKQDVEAGLAPLAALVVSRVRGGLPAPGFFDRAARLGIFDGSDPARFHSELLAVLFDSTGNPR
ncbi:MAG: hypothetical protein CMP07_12935 [Xanthomonadales bacterium]|nr:hypothetical protein [Xanthomonadales bacterium]